MNPSQPLVPSSQQRLPKLFSSYLTQLWYILAIPFFFFGFTVVYRPFDTASALEMGRDLFFFNATMLMCIVLVTLLITRTIFWIAYTHLSHNWWQYFAWCFIELTIMTYFFALYIYLMSHHVIPYFEQLAICLQYTFLVLMFPYVIITLVCVIAQHNQDLDPAVPRNLVRFHDASRQVKLVLDRDAILFIKAEENYVKVHYLENGRSREYQLRSTMSAIDPVASKNGLFRCQRSYFVNPTHITAVRKDVNNVMTVELDTEGIVIPVSRNLYKDLLAKI